MKLSIIIPVFNEEKTIAETLQRITDLTLPSITKEIIVVDDGSTDRSRFKIQDLGFKNIKVLHHKANYGKGQAVRTGISYATGEYILIQDADSEYNPQDIARLLAPIQEGKTQVVYGTRLTQFPKLNDEIRSGLFYRHFLGNKFLSLLTSILYGQWITDMETGYKIFPKKAVQSMRLQAKGFEFEPEITAKLLKAGYKILEIPITTIPRSYKEGKKLHAIRDGSKALTTILINRFTK